VSPGSSGSAPAQPGPWERSGCPHCRSTRLIRILRLVDVPTQDGRLWKTRAEALTAPSGDIDLLLCLDCGLLGNQAYEKEKVDFTDYDISTEHSPAFQAYERALAARLLSTYQLRGGTVLELGCGNGHFLQTLLEMGAARAVGIDPSRLAGGHAQSHPEIRFINDYFSEHHTREHFDLLVSRLVLDEMADQPAFLRLAHQAMTSNSGSVGYFEVPNAAQTFEHGIVWNVVYEHRIWYFQDSLETLFENAGFKVLAVAPCWNDEYLGIEVQAIHTSSPARSRGFEHHQENLLQFSTVVQTTCEEWSRRLKSLTARYSRIALWGAGARAISFLTLFSTFESLRAVVDINPARQGKFLPKSGLEVLAPETLLQLRPELILISNPTYAAEIQMQARQLGLTCDFMAL
jgi:SAM-dependent methyltransferase